MIPTLAAPNIQVPPPVDTSVFTALSSEPALGRLPLNVVPPPVTNPKVADNRPGPQTMRQGGAEALAGKTESRAFFLATNGEIALESPYSTTFVAQLFGQFALADGSGVVGGLLDFEQLAQFNMIKYKPSLAFRPREVEPQPVPEKTVSHSEIMASVDAFIREGEPVSLQDMPVMGSDGAPPPLRQAASQASSPVFSIFTSGMEAYGATQSRNMVTLATDSRHGAAKAEISLVS